MTQERDPSLRRVGLQPLVRRKADGTMIGAEEARAKDKCVT